MQYSKERYIELAPAPQVLAAGARKSPHKDVAGAHAGQGRAPPPFGVDGPLQCASYAGQRAAPPPPFGVDDPLRCGSRFSTSAASIGASASGVDFKLHAVAVSETRQQKHQLEASAAGQRQG